MSRRDSWKHLINVIANFITLAFQTALFTYVWYFVEEYGKGVHFYRRGNWAMVGMYALFMYFFTRNFDGYKIGYRRILDIFLSDILAIVLADGVQYVLILLATGTYVSPRPMAMLAVVEIALVFPWIFIVRKVYAWLYPPRKVLLIYGDRSPEDLVNKMQSRKDKYQIAETLPYDTDWEVLKARIIAHRGIGVVLDDLPAQERNVISKFCYKNDVRTYTTPKLSDIILRGAEDIHLFDTPLYLNRNQGLSIGQRAVKRTADLILGVLGLILASPFMLIIALLIKLYDNGPVFYKQQRLTRDNTIFWIYKFRSMKMDSEEDGARLASKEDDRITPVGKVIRAIHFDELPQLINIIKGDMSMVGPRPERPEIRDQYLEKIPEFDFRLKVKAGLTGYAQVFGKYNTTPYDKLKMDLTYIQNFSYSLDLKILLLTAKILFQHEENTEGVEEGQKSALK